MEMNVAENLPSKDGETSDNTMEKTPRQDVWNMADLEGMFRKVAETRKGREKLMKSYKRLRYIYHQLKERLEVEQEKKNTGQEKTGDSQVKADDVKLQEASVVTSRPNENTDTTHLKEPCREQPAYDGKNQHLRASATLHASTSSEGPHCLPKAGNVIPAHTEGRSYEITDEDSDAEDVLEHEPMITGESSAASDARNVAMPQSSVYRYVQGVNPGVVSLPNTDMIDVQSLYKSLGIQNVYTSESPKGSDTHHTQERGMSSSCFQGLNAQQPPKQGMSSFFAEASLNGSRSDPQMNPVASLDHGASVVAADTSKNELKKMLFPCTVCPICNKSFSAKSVLKKHLLIHSNTRPFKCGTCGNGFNSRSSLQTHERLHSGERPYACRYCELRFAVSSHRTTHERTHTKEQPYQCEFCSRRFSLSCSLQRHRRLHTGERPHKCSECGSDFKQKEHLKYHKAKYHTGEKLHKCTECSEAFVYAQQLKHHKARVHTGEMLYKCTYCSQAFSYPHQLRSHRAEVHMDETPYKCSHCGDAFNSCQERDDHRDKVHTGGNPYKCDDCVCVFYHPKELNHHRMQVHQDKTSQGQSDFPTDVDVDVD